MAAPTYSHGKIVRAITSFYTFWTRMHPLFDQQDFMLLPLGGWPHITSGSLAPLNKNETVIKLLKHIPYFDYPGGDDYAIRYKTGVVQYNSEDAFERTRSEDDGRRFWPLIYKDKVPPHAVCLMNGHRDGY